MDITPEIGLFDDAYRTGTPPWVIGEPQQAVVRLERDGLITGRVLDIGCGAGEHTILLAGLGYDVTGIDLAPHAVELARENAAAHHVTARFEVADAFALPDEAPFDTILDSALFHIFDDGDRARYVAGLHRACRPGAVVHVLALSDRGRGFGPEVSETAVREAFSQGWTLESLTETTYTGIDAGTRVAEPAWLVRARRGRS
ncbi:MAG: SAM-dependent methyltransferase [Mycobacterium sp.]|jgi:SAM-dependent methyltransferase|nr:SAM-dependent methyltransferase [Mycobacterium sp.]